MICEGCGFEAVALRTVRWRKGERRFALCGGCHRPLSARVWVVPAPFVVTSRCERCGRYCNPRELDPATSRPGGGYKRDLHSTGVCRNCSSR